MCGIDVNEYGDSVRLKDARRRGKERIRRDQDLVPGSIPQAATHMCSAAVPELQATAKFVPTYSAHARSSS